MFRIGRRKKSPLDNWEILVKNYVSLRHIRKVAKHMMRALRKRRKNFIQKDPCQLALERAVYKGEPWSPLGCSPRVARQHLQSMFSGAVGWHNTSQWHVGFIMPPCSFAPHDVMQAYDYKNLRPIWGKFKPIYAAPTPKDGIPRPTFEQLLPTVPYRIKKKAKR